MAMIRVNGRRVRRPGTCWNHDVEVEQGALCRLCKLRLRLRYQRRAPKPSRPVCLRCEKKGTKPWRGKLCWICRRTLARNPDADTMPTRRKVRA